MRPVLCLLMLVSYGVHAQSAPDPFEMTQRIAENGAPQLALARVEQMQPAAATAPGWTDWEQLRCVLLGRLMRSDELAKRVAALPSGVPEPAVRVCLLQGARAAIATGQAVNARKLFARLMWRQGLSADEMRHARALVIESYLAEQQPQNAFALMLRYEL
ncbi:MAG TPA: hypothetical protein VGO84_03550, partial [Burkholderiales bacterium]|nr:hypothetical protein [Burkholderiales bacterium]